MSAEQNDQSLCDNVFLDRLVDGALPGDERRALFARLELEPDGWRRCALAFLEAQAWSEAASGGPEGWVSAAQPTDRQFGGLHCADPPYKAPLSGSSRHLARVPRLLSIAAGLVVAFGLGWVMRGGQAEPGIVRVERAPTEVVARSSNATLKDVPAPRPRTANPAPSLPTPIVKQLERQGYQLERRQRLVSMETRDGRRLALPVDEVRVRFVKDRTY